ncbi:MAG: outer membrane protein assembly factor BamE [Pseudomonadota bacterium]
MRTLYKLTAAVCVAAAVLLGCDLKKIAELEEGVATEAQVRAQFGEPVAVYDEPGGSRTLEYPRQPQGQRNYMITIGPDGKMSALRQVLQPATFRRIVAGMDTPQVRRLLGAPARRLPLERQQQEVWDWRFLNGQEAKIFSVTFDAQGKVLSTAETVDEPR